MKEKEKKQQIEISFDLFGKKGNLTIDEDTENLMICKIIDRHDNGKEKIGFIRDIFGDGSLRPYMTRIDNKYYNEKDACEIIEKLSKELNLEIYN